MKRVFSARLLLCAALICCGPFQVFGETLRIGAWNIQDLHHQEGHSLRKFGNFPSVRRNTTDFILLEKYRDLFGSDGTPADVIALQEIGTGAALDRLFPSDTYLTLMSSRWEDDSAPEGEGEVHTAVAIRKDSGVELLERADLPQLAMMDRDGGFSRAGTGALLKAGEMEFWFLSVHMKSGCPDTKRIHESTGVACETLWRQALVLRDWVVKKRETGTPIVIAGDFNRRFRQLQDRFGLWKALNDTAAEADIDVPLFEKHPETVTRKCPTKKGTSLEPIDWILIDLKLTEHVVPGSFFERRWTQTDQEAAQGGRGLSDHCPISLDLLTSADQN